MSEHDMMTCNVTDIDKGVLVSIVGEIDFNSSAKLRLTLKKITREKPDKLIVDLSAVPYMDSSGLAVLVETLQSLTKSSGQLILCHLSQKVKGIFEIARLDMVFRIAENLEAAKTL